MSRSTTTITGNLTRDPELKFTKGGTALCSFSVASNYRFQKDGDWEEKVSFFDVTVWGPNGEQVAAVLADGGKGAPVIVTGRLEQQTWEDKDGGNRSKIVLVADEVGILTRGIETWERKVSNGGQQQQRSNKPSGNKSAGGSRQQSYQYDDQEPF